MAKTVSREEHEKLKVDHEALKKRYSDLMNSVLNREDRMVEKERYDLVNDEKKKLERRLGEVLVENGNLRELHTQAVLDRLRAIEDKDQVYKWWGARQEAIKTLTQAHGIWDKVASIIANGSTGDPKEPNYQRELNKVAYRAEVAEKERDKFAHELMEARDTLENAVEGYYLRANRDGMSWYVKAGLIIKELREWKDIFRP